MKRRMSPRARRALLFNAWVVEQRARKPHLLGCYRPRRGKGRWVFKKHDGA